MKSDIPRSSTPSDEQYWHRLHNWLQTRDQRNRFTSIQWKEGPDNASIWNVICRGPPHLSPRLIDSYTPPTVDGQDYGRGRGKKLMLAKNGAAQIALDRLNEEAMSSTQSR